MDEHSDDVPVVQRRRRRISRNTREQTPEPSTGRIEYHNNNNANNSSRNSNDENSSLDRSSDNIPASGDGGRRSDSKRSIIRSALNFSGHKNKILNMRDKKIHATSIRSQSTPREEKESSGPPEILNLFRRAKRSLSAPRKREESSDSGKYSVNSQDRVIADIQKRTSQVYENIHKQFEKSVPTDDKRSAQLEANLSKFNDDRRKFELEKLKFLQEKRELDRMRLRRFERYKQEMAEEVGEFPSPKAAASDSVRRNENSSDKLNTLEDKQRQERLQNLEREEKQEQLEQMERVRRQEKQYRLEQLEKKERREQQEKLEKQERLIKVEKERQEKLLNLKSRIEYSVDRQEKQDRPQVRRRRNVKNYESTSTCSSSGDDEYVSSALSDSSSQQKTPPARRATSKVRPTESSKSSTERSMERSVERTIKKSADSGSRRSIEKNSDREVSRSREKNLDRTSEKREELLRPARSAEKSVEKEQTVSKDKAEETSQPSETAKEQSTKTEETQVVANGKSEETKSKEAADLLQHDKGETKSEEKAKATDTIPFFKAAFSDISEFYVKFRKYLADNPRERRAIRMQIKKCVAYSMLFVIIIGAGGVLFRFTEGSFESQYKCGVKRIKRDFIDQLWLSSHNLREEDWKTSARTRLRKFEEELQISFNEGMKSYSGMTTWNFVNGVLYCLTIVTTIGYGHISPSTDTGRLITILYAVIGIPIFLLLLADFGKLLTRCIKFLWVFVRRLYYTGSCRKVRKTAPMQNMMQGLNVMYDMVRRPSQLVPDSNNLEAQNSVPPALTPVSDAPQTPIPPDTFEIDDEFNLPISVAISILLGYMVFGATLYCMCEPWSFFESFYFVFISISTIGLGDYVPTDPIFMIFSIIYLIFGLALTSMCINVVQLKLSDSFRKASAKIGQTIGLQMAEAASQNSRVQTPADIASVNSTSSNGVSDDLLPPPLPKKPAVKIDKQSTGNGKK